MKKINRKGWIARGLVMAASALLLSGAAQVSPPMPTVDLSVGPVAINSQAVNVALALSVEFPTVGAAYRNSTYNHSTVYLGYWDSKGCYDYKDTTPGAPLGGEYFFRTGDVDVNGYCNTGGAGTGYSGNALNYVATSSIDLLRYGLTGGDRVADTDTTTILARAYLRAGWLNNGSNFPSRRIPAALEGLVTPDYPDSSTADVYAGSCDDRVVFGRSNSSNNCTSPGTSGNLNKGVPSGAPTVASVVYGSAIPAAHQSAPGFALGTVTWDVTNPLVTQTSAPTNGGPTTDTYVRYVSVPGTTNTAAPGGPVSQTPVSSTYTASGTRTTPLAGAPNTSVLYYNTATTSPAVWDSVNPGAGFGRAFTFANTSSGNRGIRVCEIGGRVFGRLSGGLPTSSGVTNSWCDDPSGNPDLDPPLPGNANRSRARPEFGWSNSNNSSQVETLYERYNKVPVYQNYTVANLYQNWAPQTVYRVYEQRQYYTYYASSSPGPMYARVRVCDGSEATTRTDLCWRYPNGNYKPIGEIQRRAEGLRVAAFGYLMDDTRARYGGVLRAPMRFTGPNYRDSGGIVQTNPAPEWDVNSGIFATDPLNASPTFPRSGVINYLNKFGSTGVYKTYDPVGELYYEVLRYFQGLPPTAAASSGLTAGSGLYDNFPVYNTVVSGTSTTPGWADPVQNACQRRNFILAIGDNNTHNDRQLPGHGTGVSSVLVNSDDPARAVEPLLGDATKNFNVVDWTNVLSGFETNTSVAYTDALGRSQNTLGNPSPNGSNSNLASKSTGATNAAYYWAGAAYWANTQPIRLDTKGGQSMKDVRVKTFIIDVDENGNGSLQPTRSFYLAGKYGWFADANLDGNPYKTSGGVTNNAEWEDANAPGTPDGYVVASQAQKMLDGIKKFFSAAASEKGAVSVSSLSSQRFTTSEPNGDLFSPRFDSRDWSGTVQRTGLRYNTTTGNIDTLAGVKWDANTILTYAANNSTATLADPYVKPADRKIFTMAGGASATTGQAFTVANKGALDAAVQAALNTNPTTAAVDGQADIRINWIRGVRSDEQNSTSGTLRRRNSIMGDIINSGPVYKKGVDTTAEGPGIAAFADSVASRIAMIYVGANDGMMHGFRASDGKEMFAYIPRAVAQNLNKLTHPNYVHQPFVDGVPAVNEARVNGSWKTVLASGMGGGAQGVFAIDVTSPTTFGASNIMFEFTDQDDSDMGNILFQPRIVRMRMAGAGAPVYKWFIAVGSGMNNYKNDGSYSLTGRQALFLLSLDKQPTEAWTLNTNYFKVLLSDPVTTMATGLTNPGFAPGPSGEAAILYAGDLQGNMWKFDFSSGLSSTNATNAVKTSSGVPIPMVIAKDASSNRQPISAPAQITPGLGKGFMVVFGTGKFMEPSDGDTVGVQAVYGVWDSLSDTAGDFQVGRSKLYQRTMTVGTATTTLSGSATFALGSGTSGTYRGWYVDLPAPRERVATEGAQGLGFVAFNSTIPEGGCSGDGSGRAMCFGSVYGTAQCAFSLSKIGLLSKPNVTIIDDTIVTTRSPTGRRKETVRQALVTTGTQITSAGNTNAQTEKISAQTVLDGRMGWREIRNFR
ncbi:MAG: hypothetical protein KF740_05605 [Ramlibacter sp.]|nr:hypothetical protein [Ramlibacter sp.]